MDKGEKSMLGPEKVMAMLLGNKKSEKIETNWCLILNPIYSELDKRKVARKISEAFSLSSEESNDLVNNTPIILLDNLPKTTAESVKEYFRPTGAELLMTNEVYMKRKCYRTVWPEQPSLSFLNGEKKTSSKPAADQEPLRPDEALNEIRSLRDQVERFESDEDSKIKETVQNEEQEQLTHELDLLKKERDNWRDKFESQRRTLEKMSWEMSLRDSGSAKSNNAAYADEKEAEKQKARLKSMEEKYEALQEEYQQARNLFEEKLSSSMDEVMRWKNQFKELERTLKDIDDDRKKDKGDFEALAGKARDAQQKCRIYEEENKELKAKLEAAREFTSDEVENLQAELAEANRQIESVKGDQKRWEEEKRLLVTASRKEEEKRRMLEEEYQNLKNLLGQKTSLADKEKNEWKDRFEEVSQRFKSIEANYNGIVSELESKKEDLRVWEIKGREFDQTVAELQASHDNLEKMLSVNLKQLEQRDKELDAMRRQLKDLKTLNEQREAVTKRSLISTIISEKETLLKQLIEDQQRVEGEIRLREETIRKILSDQEKIEKEIMEGKQSQRHYMEMIKREKTPKFKSDKDDNDI